MNKHTDGDPEPLKAVTPELCKVMMSAQKDAMAANIALLEEKIKSIKGTIVTTGAAITIVLGIIQFLLTLYHP